MGKQVQQVVASAIDVAGELLRIAPQIGWQQGRQADEHVAEIDEGIVTVTLAGGQQAEEDGGRPTAAIAATEEPILAADGDASQGVFGGIVVDVQPA